MYCSEGDLTNPLCQKVIGYSTAHGWTEAPAGLVDRTLDAAHPNSTFYALLKDDKGEITKLDLDRAQGAATAAFKALFPADRAAWKYKAGVMSHARRPWWTPVRESAELAASPFRFHDTYEMIVDYAQKKLDKFKEAAGDESGLGLETQKEVNARNAAQLKTLKALVSGSGDQLYRSYVFGATIYRHAQRTLNHVYWGGNANFQAGVKAAYTAVYNSYLLNKGKDEKVSWLIYTQEGGPLGCSEEDWKSPIARRLIGFSVKDQRIWAPLTMTDPFKN